LAKHIYSPEHGIAFIKETRNITDYEFVGEHIMNFGLDVGELEQRTHQKMSRLEIVEPPSSDKKHPTRVEGNQLVLFRPHLSESTMETSPPHWERKKPLNADECRQKLREYQANQIKSLKKLQDDLLQNPPPGFSKGELEEQNQLDMDDVMEHQRRETQVLENWIKEDQKVKLKPEKTGKSGGEKK